MCTVTFIPAKDRFYITSNRDERLNRKEAISPKFYTHENNLLLYPKDTEAGGSWIGIHENGNTAVLLNGAFTKHVSMPAYKKSRGIIFLDILSCGMPVGKFLQMDLLNIEPFTLIVFEDNNLYECRWDGHKTFCKQTKKFRPHIWSSATLYDMETVKKREQWFEKWLNRNPSPSQKDIIHFHMFAGDGNAHNDLRMNRDDIMSTVSITSIELFDGKASVHYADLKNDSFHVQHIQFIPCFETA